MSKIEMIKGCKTKKDDIFYLIQQDQSSSSQSLMKLTIKRGKGNIWSAKIASVYSQITGQVLALELDHEHQNFTAYDQLFLVDQTPSVIHLRQNFDKNEDYQLIQRFSLADDKEIKTSLNTLLKKDFTRATISERCITILNNTIIYASNFMF